MGNFDVLFAKVSELTQEDDHVTVRDASPQELDEIEELRRFSAELQEPEPCSYTTT